jgi:hypothetical protein
MFAALILRKVPLTEAFIRAGYPVVGARGPSGQVWEKGWSPEGAQRRSAQLAACDRVQNLLAFWQLPVDEQLRMLHPDAVAVYQGALKSKKEDGSPTSLAVQVADSIMDRTGFGRSQKIQRENVGADTAKQIEQIEAELAEAMEERKRGAITAEFEILPQLPPSPKGGEPDAE